MRREIFERIGRESAGRAEERRIRPRRETAALTAALREIRVRMRKAPPERPGPTLGWILDNASLAEREGEAAYSVLRRADFAAAGEETALGGLCRALVRSRAGELTQDEIFCAVDAYTEEVYMPEKELALLPAMLCAHIVIYMAEVWQSIDGVEEREQKYLHPLSRAIRALHALQRGMLEDIVLRCDRVERILGEDPEGLYPRLDEQSRSLLRQNLLRIAKQTEERPDQVARRLISEGMPVQRLQKEAAPRPRTGRIYFAVLASLTLAVFLLFYLAVGDPAAAVLLVLPAAAVARALCDFFTLRLVPPRCCLRLELSEGIPEQAKTLCVITSLITRPGDARALGRRLQEFRAANRNCGENLWFGLLLDYKDAETEHLPEDDALRAEAEEVIRELNREDAHYFLFLRERSYAVTEARFMGRERKRGALCDLFDRLRGEGDLPVFGGQLPTDIRYVLTLDSDTRAEPYSILPLVAALACPANAPQIQDGRVQAGYAMAMPRIVTDITAAHRSALSRLTAGNGGCDPYGSVVSDLYMDLFGAASFTGKGLIDVDAYRACLSNLPEGRILSHDLLESGYLRCALQNDVEMTDGCPWRAGSFYSRLRRWIRGDIQIAAWIGRRVPAAEGNRVKNPLDGLTRYKIFDNLRRAATDPALLALLLYAVLVRSGGAFAAAVICIAMPELLGALAGEMGRGVRAWRYHSSVAAGLGAGIFSAAMRLWLLPVRAFVSVSAAFISLRGLVLKKKMLAWVTAAETEASGQNAASVWKLCFPAVLCGAVLLSAGVMGTVMGILWLLSPVCAASLSAPCGGETELRPRELDRLRGYALEIWTYFRDMIREEDHFLIPDNLQEEPSVGVAHRTSPTDIGFGLCAVICGLDLGFVEDPEGLELLSGQIGALERQKKWRGHIYNWVDTRTCRPMPPYGISTVDSGNLAAALLLCSSYGAERGGDFAELGCRARSLFDAMDFAVLYDRRRDLFSIGAATSDNRRMEGCYDLLASEARLTGFIAAAFGHAGEKFWGRLGRGLVGHRGYAGLASWTGSMFEYLMPELFLPRFPNSLLSESADFCIAAQIRHRPAGTALWGTSESGYRAFDRGMSYQYKAHGVPRLALKRGMGRDAVVSPYSVFLALPYAPRAAMRCLSAFARLGLYGRYGFYEAADFTASRIGGRKFEPVASYMSHHMGMSLMSLHLVLTRGKNPRRMMEIPELSAYAGLLKERLPVGATVMRRFPAELAERGRRNAVVEFARETAGDAADPEGCLMANDAYTLLMDERGLGSAFYEGCSVYRGAEDRLGMDGGLQAWLVTEKEILPLATVAGNARIRRRCVRSENAMTIECSSGEVSLLGEIFVSRSNACEIRDYKIVNNGDSPLQGQLILCFEPQLCPRADYEAHPTYRRLFMKTEAAGQAVLACRRERGGELWLAFALASPGVEYETSRETLIGRRGYDPRQMRFAGGMGNVLDPCIAARAPISVPAGGDVSLRACLSVARERGAALQGLQGGKPAHPERADFLQRGVLQRMHADQHAEAQRLSARLLFTPYGKQPVGALPDRAYAGLWRLGISGDLPLLLARCRADGTVDPFPLFCFAMYRRAGLPCEMVILTEEGDAYLRPERDAVLNMAAEYGLTESSQLHVIDRESLSEGDLPLLHAAACIDFTQPRRETPALRPRRALPFEATGGAELPARSGDLSTIAPSHATPVVWSMPLAGRNFGCIAEDVGPGGMWYRNARLFRQTAFSMDPLGGGLEERMVFTDGEHALSLFKDGEHPCGVRFDLGCVVWDKQAAGISVRTRMFCPVDVPARVVLVEGYAEREMTLYWYLRPLLGEREADRTFLQARPSAEGGAEVRNAAGQFFTGKVFVCLGSGKPDCTCYAPHAWSEWTEGEPGLGGDALVQLRFAPVNGSFCLFLVAGIREDADDSSLRRLATRDGAERALAETRAHFARRVAALRPETPEADLNAYISGACLYQVLASRIYAKASLWQCGGGNGFRDQLQDVCALTLFDAPLVRQTLLEACARQYEEGDVMHWWHDLPDGCMGVRTRCSDDLLWLPYAVFEYVNVTGDRSILEEQVPYLSSPPLEDGERSRCERPGLSSRKERVLDHCVRACDMVAERGLGAHGLPLMLGGDWNDGMDLVGAEGHGESVWLGFFAANVFRRTALLCRRADMCRKAEELTFFARGMANSALEARADGAYIRAYWDDGTPLGNGEGEGALDSIAQSFSTWVPEGRREEKRAAVWKAAEQLWDRERSYVRLLSPAFTGAGRDPGYIADYPPGIRENGGQYTHAAVWLCMALFEVGEAETGCEMLLSLLPKKRREEIRKTENFVLTGDVYDHPDHRGRGGWSWYTGAAGWYMQAVMRCLFGLRFSDGILSFFPFLPKGWEGYAFELDIGEARLRVQVRRGAAPGVYLNGDRIENELRPGELEGKAEILVIV